MVWFFVVVVGFVAGFSFFFLQVRFGCNRENRVRPLQTARGRNLPEATGTDKRLGAEVFSTLDPVPEVPRKPYQ